jgi:hypothetical protein
VLTDVTGFPATSIRKLPNRLIRIMADSADW